jgi:hypothetical protein
MREAAGYYFNQQTYDVWIEEIIQKAIVKALEIAERNPTSWMSYNLPYWKERRAELVTMLEPMAQEIFDNKPGISYNSFLTQLIIAVGQIFQKSPWTRRHVQYAASLGKHPKDVEKRRAGRQFGFSPKSSLQNPNG